MGKGNGSIEGQGSTFWFTVVVLKQAEAPSWGRVDRTERLQGVGVAEVVSKLEEWLKKG